MILMSSCYFVPDPADPRSREGTDITKLRRRRAGTFRRTDARDSTDSEIGVATERTPLARLYDDIARIPAHFLGGIEINDGTFKASRGLSAPR